jgi:hypothetical protein
LPARLLFDTLAVPLMEPLRVAVNRFAGFSFSDERKEGRTMPKKKTRRQQKKTPRQPIYPVGEFLRDRMTLPPVAGQWTTPAELADASRVDELMDTMGVRTADREQMRVALLDAFEPTKHVCEWTADAALLVLVRSGRVPMPQPGSAVWRCLRPADPAFLLHDRRAMQELGASQDDLDRERAFWRGALVHFGDEIGRDLRAATDDIVDAFGMRVALHAQHAGTFTDQIEQIEQAPTLADMRAIQFGFDAEGDRRFSESMDAAARVAVLEVISDCH